MIYTKNQQEALDYRGGNLLIIACAGSGKTQVLSRRIALLVSEGVPKESIIAFTFTDMAAGELKSRIRKELASLREEGRIDDASLGEIYIGTIHDDPELRSKVLHAEKPFEFIIGDAMISGTIDLLNKADPAGENEAKVEIVDFKTGKSGDDLAAAERRSHVQQQLQMYAIATQDALGLEPLKATAHFLYANQPHIKEDVELSEEQMENMKHQIANTVTAIKQGRFPLCASKTRCTSCDFKAICNGSTR